MDKIQLTTSDGGNAVSSGIVMNSIGSGFGPPTIYRIPLDPEFHAAHQTNSGFMTLGLF